MAVPGGGAVVSDDAGAILPQLRFTVVELNARGALKLTPFCDERVSTALKIWLLVWADNVVANRAEQQIAMNVRGETENVTDMPPRPGGR
jgi:hypothetical protein